MKSRFAQAESLRGNLAGEKPQRLQTVAQLTLELELSEHYLSVWTKDYVTSQLLTPYNSFFKEPDCAEVTMETNQNKLNWTVLTCFEYTNVECKDNIPVTRNKIASGTQHSK